MPDEPSMYSEFGRLAWDGHHLPKFDRVGKYCRPPEVILDHYKFFVVTSMGNVEVWNGAIWVCNCGRRWRLNGQTWMTKGWLVQHKHRKGYYDSLAHLRHQQILEASLDSDILKVEAKNDN